MADALDWRASRREVRAPRLLLALRQTVFCVLAGGALQELGNAGGFGSLAADHAQGGSVLWRVQGLARFHPGARVGKYFFMRYAQILFPEFSSGITDADRFLVVTNVRGKLL